MALFKNSYKKGEMFQDKGIWFIAESSGYQNASDLEDGFDIFLPGSGVYTVAREATTEEISAHLSAIAQTEAHETDGFEVGCKINRKGASGAPTTVVAVNREKRTIQFLAFNGSGKVLTDFAKFFEVING